MFEEDEAIVDEEPINEADLFGEDPAPLGSPTNDEAAANTEEAGDGVTAPPPKRRKQINRLAPLNHAWLLDENREGVAKVNSYFQGIKYKSGNRQEAKNLGMILKRYEYWAQQCYPKLCFQDFVEKVEEYSGKGPIKHFLQHNRRKDQDDDQNNDQQNNDDNANDQNDILFGNEEDNEPPASPVASTPLVQSTPVQSVIIDESVRETIRRKREEALTKRQRRLEESSLNATLESSNKDPPVNDSNKDDDDLPEALSKNEEKSVSENKDSANKNESNVKASEEQSANCEHSLNSPVYNISTNKESKDLPEDSKSPEEDLGKNQDSNNEF